MTARRPDLHAPPPSIVKVLCTRLSRGRFRFAGYDAQDGRWVTLSAEQCRRAALADLSNEELRQSVMDALEAADYPPRYFELADYPNAIVRAAAAEQAHQTAALRLKQAGKTHKQIAARLAIPLSRVPRLLARAQQAQQAQ